MLDLTSKKGRIVSAALGLAAERPWRDVGLADIAARAGTSLAMLRTHFAGKSEILAAFTRLVDDEVLRRAPRLDDTQARRDALFEVVMSRFDVLEPYKGALKSIVGHGLPEPGQILPILASQRWMLEAAGIRADGIDGSVRVAGLMSVYAAVFRTWLDDNDAGLARTMAALDRRLRRGERTMQRMDDVCQGVSRMSDAIFGALRGAKAKAPSSPAEPASPAPQPPSL
ncbi:MAG: TetR family transcriptional regulator [Hyphomicrobiaceae bacterium]